MVRLRLEEEGSGDIIYQTRSAAHIDAAVNYCILDIIIYYEYHYNYNTSWIARERLKLLLMTRLKS